MDKSVHSSLSPQVPDASESPAEAANRQVSSLEMLLESIDDSVHKSTSRRSQTKAAHQLRMAQARLGVAGSLYAALRAKHAPTAAHSLRVALGCSSWSMGVDLARRQRDEIEISALLHDIGKIGVPDQILLKPGRLSDEEYAQVEWHRQNGLEIFVSCCSSKELMDIIHYASARYDGGRQGFDRSGQDLPLGSRMIAIVDAFDAMTTDHVYRRALSRERAMAELFENSGGQFDPTLVKQFCSLLLSDKIHLNSEVARRWLQELQPESSNSFWALGHLPQASGVGIGEDPFQQTLLSNMKDAVIFVDTSRRIMLWNGAAFRMTGITESSVYQKLWSPELIGLHDESDQPITDADCPVADAMKSSMRTVRRLTIRSKGDSEQRTTVNVHIASVLGQNGEPVGATMLLHNVSSQINLEEQVVTLHKRATHDPLTKISNRAEFDQVFVEFIESHLERSLPFSLIICDLDHFKQVNDNYGHQAGDEALISFASLLRRFCRPGDLVARYGGEEFVMLCADCDNATATRRADEIRRELARIPQLMLEGNHITASFGVTEIQSGDTVETMLRRADRGLLKAKDLGRNRVVQLGSGIDSEEQPEKKSFWFSWFRRQSPEQILQQAIITAVPVSFAIEKLRGFVADHCAEITMIEEHHIALKINGQHEALVRRENDRAVPFVIELLFSEASSDEAGKIPQGKRTQIEVCIRPMRSRDRRVSNLDTRAKHLFVSLKSYLMAQDAV